MPNRDETIREYGLRRDNPFICEGAEGGTEGVRGNDGLGQAFIYFLIQMFPSLSRKYVELCRAEGRDPSPHVFIHTATLPSYPKGLFLICHISPLSTISLSSNYISRRLTSHVS